MKIATGCTWQIRRQALDRFRTGLQHGLIAAQANADPEHRVRLASIIETRATERIRRAPGASPWLWREVGTARLIGGDPEGAERAFLTAYQLWPHEQAEYGLGLAMAAQNRRIEALHHLARVCRVNPVLAAEITDADLRRSVMEVIRAPRP